jgi:ectoine hydroxylase-related dioxygenase (phytanoyl-CoA dioxygenase family)
MGLDAGNIRQEENMYLALPREVVASYPEQIQRLLGWSVNASNAPSLRGLPHAPTWAKR